ncbi:hypothetical protein Drorol1_Dr00027729 [Drosera rotundifolia]
MPTSGTFLRQLSTKETWKPHSKRWVGDKNRGSEMGQRNWNQMEGLNGENGGFGAKGGCVMRKRVIVVVDETMRSRHAMIWALTHVTNKGDFLTLLHVVKDWESGDDSSGRETEGHLVVGNLGDLCRACKPEVGIEVLVVQGPKLATVLSQVKKLEVSVLVLGHKKPSSPLFNCLFGVSSSSEEEFVEQCINGADCLTIGVSKQSKGMGGYLISTRWQKNFWLLA